MVSFNIGRVRTETELYAFCLQTCSSFCPTIFVCWAAGSIKSRAREISRGGSVIDESVVDILTLVDPECSILEDGKRLQQGRTLDFRHGGITAEKVASVITSMNGR